MTSVSLLHDHASAMTRAIVARFNWGHESQAVEAFRELFPVVKSGLEEFELKRALLNKRLRPLTANDPTTEENSRASE